MRPNPGDTICGRVRIGEPVVSGFGAPVFGLGLTAVLTDTEQLVWLTVVERTLVPSQADLSRFMAGANGLSALPHEALVPVTIVDREADFCIVGFEPPPHVTPLAALTDDLRSPELAARVAVEVARALAFVHREGRVHGTLDLGAVVLADGRPRVVQYGIAELCDPERLIPAMGEGPFAPELLGGAGLGATVDVFDWGALVASLLTGRGRTDAIVAVFHDEVPQSPLLQCVKAALSSDPAQRPTDGTALLQLLSGSPTHPEDPGASGFAEARELASRYLQEPQDGAPGATGGEAPATTEPTRRRRKGRRNAEDLASGLAPRRGEMVAPDAPDPDPFTVAVVPRAAPPVAEPPAAASAPEPKEEAELHLPNLRGTAPGGEPAADHALVAPEPAPQQTRASAPAPPTPTTERPPAPPPPSNVVPERAAEASLGRVQLRAASPTPPPAKEPAPPPTPAFAPLSAAAPAVSPRVELDQHPSAGAVTGASNPRASATSSPGFKATRGTFPGAAGGPPGVAALGPSGASMAALIALVATLLAVGLTVPVAAARGGLAAFLGVTGAPEREAAEARGDTDAEPPGGDAAVRVPARAGCPADMVQVGVASKTRTFACIDAGESPGLRHAPDVNVTLDDARAACAAVSKRLCSTAQWRRACEGPKGTRFPYGNRREPARCNEASDRGVGQNLSRSGAREGCVSHDGAYDLVGNVAEWVEEGVVLGGDATSRAPHCGTKKKQAAGSAMASIGFRCCATAPVDPPS